MNQKYIDQLTLAQLQLLETESQRAWEDKKREQSREAMQTQREYIGKGFDLSREDIERARK